jgi:hypothetical protein
MNNYSRTSNQQSHSAKKAARLRKKRILAVATLSCAALAISTAALADNNSQLRTPTTATSMQDSSTSNESCNFEATVQQGREAALAQKAVEQQSERTLRHAGSLISISETGDLVTVAALVDADLYLRVTAVSTRSDELIDLVKDAIDENETLATGEGDLAFTINGNRCDLTSADDRGLTINEIVSSDISLGFQDDETSCDLKSLFAATNGDGSFDIGDLNLGDLDLDLDLDLNSTDNDGFAVKLDTGHGTIGLNCSSKRR